MTPASKTVRYTTRRSRRLSSEGFRVLSLRSSSMFPEIVRDELEPVLVSQQLENHLRMNGGGGAGFDVVMLIEPGRAADHLPFAETIRRANELPQRGISHGKLS